jgi:hypothetical protein
LKAYGIVDRDFRCEAEIISLRDNSIYVLGVAEVENLFITQEIFMIINNRLARSDDSAVTTAVDFVINIKFENMKAQQVRNAAITEYKYQLSPIDLSNIHSDDDIKKAISAINYDSIHTEASQKYEITSYNEILKLFNQKGLSKEIGVNFGINNQEYCGLIIRLVNSDMTNEFRDALKPYLPAEIPFTIEKIT